MTKKEKFINVVEELFRKTDIITFAGEDYEDVMVYFQALKETREKEKPAFTDNGRMVLQYMQDNKELCNNLFKAKSIGEGLGISSRTASGAMRKLVSDEYVEKIGENPICYSLTAKGIEVDLTN